MTLQAVTKSYLTGFSKIFSTLINTSLYKLSKETLIMEQEKNASSIESLEQEKADEEEEGKKDESSCSSEEEEDDDSESEAETGIFLEHSISLNIYFINVPV